MEGTPLVAAMSTVVLERTRKETTIRKDHGRLSKSFQDHLNRGKEFVLADSIRLWLLIYY